MPRETASVETRKKAVWYRLHNVGDEFTGLLLSNPEKREATDMDGNKIVNDRGEPRYEYVYTFLNVNASKHPETCHWCSVRTSEDDYTGDTGLRKFSAKPTQHFQIQEAVAAARNDAGQPELFGPLTLKFTAKKKPEPPAKFATNIYAASYRIPTDEEVDRVDQFHDAKPGTSAADDVESQKEIMSKMGNLLDV